jgi:glutamine synthetase
MSASKILKEIKEKDVKYVDVRFTDTRGKLQHVTFDIDLVDEDFLNEGTMFDGSSIAGWKAINESDMMLMPDLTTAVIDPFYQQTTMVLFCDVLNPDTGEPYNRDPLDGQEGGSLCQVDRAWATPSISVRKPSSSSSTTSAGRPSRTTPATRMTRPNCRPTPAPNMTEGNMGHRPGAKGGYFPVNPVDSVRTCAAKCWA